MEFQAAFTVQHQSHQQSELCRIGFSRSPLTYSSLMAQTAVTASSQTFSCESCGHLNVVPFHQPDVLKAADKAQEPAAEQAPSEHQALEQVDLPSGLDGQKPERTISRLADDTEDLNALAAANAAQDGKLEQHLEELHLHQAHAHSPHHLGQRRASHLHPSGLIPRRPSLLSRQSSEAQDIASQEEEQQLHQHLGSRTNSGANMPGHEAGTVVFTLKGPTEVILAQLQRNIASVGSGASSHNRTPSGTPMARAGVPQMFNVSYPGAPPNLNRPSMLGVAPGTPGTGAEGSATEGTSGSPRRDKDSMFRCPICFEDLHKDDVFVASMCGHEMCRGCARQMVLTAISQLEFPLACPVCKAGPSPACVHCEEVVRGHTNERYCSIDPDVQLVLSPEEYEDYMDKSMKFASNRDSELTSCPKPDCQGMAVVLSREPIFLCPLCNYAWCRRCKCDWHSFQTCDQHQREKLSSKQQDEPHDKAFQAWLKENRTIACPTCGQGLQKQEGCNHLQCTSCKSHVCWLCGKKIEASTYWEAYTHYWDPESPCYGGTYDARMDHARVEG
ncbi:hypothetical protein WJX82_006165 [Trebouxia sp. C0006]